MAEIWRFLRSLAHHWQAWITGGLVAAILVMGEGLRLFSAPPLFYAVFGVLAAIFASYQTWRDEAKRAEGLSAELEECRDQARKEAEALANEMIPDVPDDLYWLLAVAQKHGLRREFIPAHTGGSLNAIWIGETPVSSRESQWLYDLAADADKRGRLPLEHRPGGYGIYRVTPETARILEVERRRKRSMPATPGALHNARDGTPFTLPT